MNSFFINEDTKNIIISILSGLFGFFSSIAIEWYKKRKNPKEMDASISGTINSAAKENVETAQSLVELLDQRLAKERIYYEDQIARSKISCEEKIMELKTNYDRALFNVQIKGEQEKFELSKEIDQLKRDKVSLQFQVTDLQTRLGKYEDDVMNGKHE